MEIRSLTRFVIIAEELHFGRAAHRLHVAESALSRQIQRLEEDLQFELFDRNSRRVQLTPAGAVFLNQTRSLIDSFNAATEAGRRAAEGKTGFIRIGFVSAALCQVLPAVLHLFRKRWPSVEMELSELPTTQQLQNLQQHRTDIGFVRDPTDPDSKGLVFETVARERIAVAFPKTHFLAKCTRIRVGDLARESFIIYPSSPPVSNWEVLVRSICRKADFEPYVVQRTMQINTAISLVAAGIGIALVPRSAVSILQRGVLYRDLQETTVTELVVAYRKNESSPIVEHFLSSVQQVSCEIKSQVRVDKGRHGL
jgi:DNA-binding transcriptional LysR family regulator